MGFQSQLSRCCGSNVDLQRPDPEEIQGKLDTPDLALSNDKVTTTDPLSDGISDEP
jgi:hypothetical protein